MPLKKRILYFLFASSIFAMFLHAENSEFSPKIKSDTDITTRPLEVETKLEPKIITNIARNSVQVLGGAEKVVKTKEIFVESKSSTIFTYDKPIDEIFVEDPKTADLHLIDDKSIYILGLKTGRTSMLISTAGKTELLKLIITVMPSISVFKQILKQTLPEQPIDVVSLPRGIMLRGSVETTKDAEIVQELAERFFDGKDSILNNLVVNGSTQISLRVKVAEVSRNVTNRLGVHWQGDIKHGNINFGIIGEDVNKSFALTYQGRVNRLQAVLDTLAQEGLVSILAEPNLITASGQSASFLVGGEIPYATPQSGSSSNLTITFKKFGVNLSFTPTLIGSAIHLKLQTEVSNPDTSNSLVMNGVSIPGIATKHAETSVVLGNGQSLMIAGLLYNKTDGSMSSHQGLADIPILGAFFRSSTVSDEKKELVIIVTPYLVEPVSDSRQLEVPTDGIKLTNMIDRLLLGKLISQVGLPPSSLPSRFVGHAGFYY